LCLAIICTARYENLQLTRFMDFQLSEGECAVNGDFIVMSLKFLPI